MKSGVLPILSSAARFPTLSPDLPLKLMMRQKIFSAGRQLFPFLCLLLLGACSTAPLPEANLAEPGWNVRQGQAVWRAKKDAAEIAGEILLATNNAGRAFVQFTKTPFPFVTAQTTTNAWQIEAPAQNRRYSRFGTPPPGILWFQIAPAFTGNKLPSRWIWKKSDDTWQLRNRWTGESLEGYFTQ